MVEQWKFVEGASRYLVSNHGRVISLCKRYSPRVLSSPANNWGYLHVGICCDDGSIKRSSVHHLVASAFVPNPHGKPTVNHIDGNKSNNLASNLEWTTQGENNKHAYESGLKPRGSKHYNSKLTEEDVIEIKKRLEQGETQKSIARYYGVNRNSVSAIATGRSWSHITLGGQVV